MNYNVNYSGRGNNYIQVGSAHDAMHTKEAHEIAQYEIQRARSKMVKDAAEAGRKEAETRYNQLIDQLVAALPQEIETALSPLRVMLRRTAPSVICGVLPSS